MTADSPEMEPTHTRLARLERLVAELQIELTDRTARIDELEERIEALRGDEMVWVNTRLWNTSDPGYHTDENCSHLDSARGKCLIARSKAVDEYDLSLCSFCGNEWTPGGNTPKDPQKNRHELLDAETDPWPPEADDE